MPDIKFDCPHCNQHLEGDESLCGTNLSCPSCNGEIIIPLNAETPKPARVARISTVAAPPVPLPTQDEERDIFEVRPTPKAFLGEIVLGIVLLPFLVGVVVLLRVWHKTASLRYRLTNQRLLVTRGLIGKHIEELELYRVKDVTVNQGLLQRILGFGTLTVLSTDDTNPRIDLIGIPQPMEMKETFRANYRAARKREGVRAAEFIPS